MDIELTATTDLLRDEGALRAAFQSDGLTIVDEISEYHRKSLFGLTAMLIVTLLAKGAIAGIGGVVAKLAFEKALSQVKTGIEKLRNTGATDKAVDVVLEIRDDEDSIRLTYVLPREPQDLTSALSGSRTTSLSRKPTKPNIGLVASG